MGHGDFRSTSSPPPSRPTARVRIELVAADGTTTVLKDGNPVLAGEVIDATVMRKRALVDFYAAQIADAKARGRALLAAPQGHDDEGLRPDPLRPRGARLLPGRVRRVRRRARRRRHPRPTTASATSSTRSSPSPPSSATPSGPAIDKGLADGPGARHGRLRQGHHEPARAERRHRRRIDAGDDPHLRPDVERRRRPRRTPWPCSPTAATPACTRSSSTTAGRTAPTTPPRWDRCPTSG